MDGFVQKYNNNVIGVSNGWDRTLIWRTLRTLAVTSGMMNYLSHLVVLLAGLNKGLLFHVDVEKTRLICVESIQEKDADKARRHVARVMAAVGAA